MRPTINNTTIATFTTTTTIPTTTSIPATCKAKCIQMKKTSKGEKKRRNNNILEWLTVSI